MAAPTVKLNNGKLLPILGLGESLLQLIFCETQNLLSRI